MARITAEDCREVINNRFELVLLASHRAKELSKGAHATVEKDNDKNAVIALREIAAKTVDIELIRNLSIKNLQKHSNPDILEDKADAPSEEAEMFEQTTPISLDNEAVSVDNYIFDDEEIDLEDDK
jgi:DNA-directed RNA polymerase subunit omega